MKTPEERKEFLQKLRMAASEADDLLTSCDASDLLDGLEVARDFMFEAACVIEQLEQRLAQVERERDAAINDCGRFPRQTCEERENGDLCSMCVVKGSYRSLHRWRGVCEENSK